MHTQLTTTLSFPSSIAKLCYEMISLSQSTTWQRKLGLDTTSSSKNSDMTETTYTYWQALLRNTADQKSFGCSKASLQENSSNNFLCSKKISGEESSGVMVSTLLPSARGETGLWSNSTSQVRERQWENCDNSLYSPKASLRSYPVGLPRG